MLQSEKATPSQRRASEKIRAALEKKREDSKPRVINYNLLREETQSHRDITSAEYRGLTDLNEKRLLSTRNAGDEEGSRMARAGVGKNSDLRRKNSEGSVLVMKRSPSKKIGNEIIL